ncbi:MAG: extracellular solute-binding protein, partial [Candidatus Sumerlaeia bacterium]|nr:extracellular solute-binding protein [Candidatus Sumerlaeia bacterium]
MRLILLLLIAVFAFGCGQTASDAPKVVVYTALDREFSEPILKDFEAQTGIAVEAVYDTEAVKTVGLVNRLIAECDRPTADIFWNNEILRSLQLKRMGLTTPYSVENAEGIPAELKDPEGHWVGFASRARVILVNTDLLPNEADHPTRVEDLLDPKWKGKAGFAKPLFGTTSTHAAVLWAERGGPATTAFFTQALENAEMYPGNAQVRDAVDAGEIVWCLTDTDDAYGALVDGKPVRMIYPDTKPGEAG